MVHIEDEDLIEVRDKIQMLIDEIQVKRSGTAPCGFSYEALEELAKKSGEALAILIKILDEIDIPNEYSREIAKACKLLMPKGY